MGRPLIGEKPLTGAERARRHREHKRNPDPPPPPDPEEIIKKLRQQNWWLSHQLKREKDVATAAYERHRREERAMTTERDRLWKLLEQHGIDPNEKEHH